MALLHIARRFRDEAPTSSLCEFLRGYFYLKNAGLVGNDLRPTRGWEASELTKIPRYYIMERQNTMRGTIVRDMKAEDLDEARRRRKQWLSDNELLVCVDTICGMRSKAV